MVDKVFVLIERKSLTFGGVAVEPADFVLRVGSSLDSVRRAYEEHTASKFKQDEFVGSDWETKNGCMSGPVYTKHFSNSNAREIYSYVILERDMDVTVTPGEAND